MTSKISRRTALQGGAALLGAGLLPTPLGARAADIPSTEGYAPVPGGKIYWRRFGSGKRTPLLTLHGGPGAAHNYLLSMQALADERPVIFFDQLSAWLMGPGSRVTRMFAFFDDASMKCGSPAVSR